MLYFEVRPAKSCCTTQALFVKSAQTGQRALRSPWEELWRSHSNSRWLPPKAYSSRFLCKLCLWTLGRTTRSAKVIYRVATSTGRCGVTDVVCCYIAKTLCSITSKSEVGATIEIVAWSCMSAKSPYFKLSLECARQLSWDAAEIRRNVADNMSRKSTRQRKHYRKLFS